MFGSSIIYSITGTLTFTNIQELFFWVFSASNVVEIYISSTCISDYLFLEKMVFGEPEPDGLLLNEFNTPIAKLNSDSVQPTPVGTGSDNSTGENPVRNVRPRLNGPASPSIVPEPAHSTSSSTSNGPNGVGLSSNHEVSSNSTSNSI